MLINIIYLYAGTRKEFVDNNERSFNAVSWYAILPVAVRDIVTAIVARLAHGVVPLDGEMVVTDHNLARYTRAQARVSWSFSLFPCL